MADVPPPLDEPAVESPPHDDSFIPHGQFESDAYSLVINQTFILHIKFKLSTPRRQHTELMHRTGIMKKAAIRHRYLPLTLACIMHISRSSVCGSSSTTAFTPPPPFLAVQRHRPPTLQGAAQFDYRNTHRQSSIAAPLTTGWRNNDESIQKIKSPSNSYTQFYKEGVLVGIERTASNSRRISGEILMDIPIEDIWSILTDYDNLSTHVPNLVQSRVINDGDRILGGRPRVYQRGAQRIFGFEFGADVTMDMTEVVHHSQYEDELKMYSIDFECVDSQFFSEFDGSWILEEFNGKTMVRYIVDVRPKGPVPVAALEWRIKEDVPVNIIAVSKSARARSAERTDTEQNILEVQQEIEPIPQPQQQLVSRQQPPPAQPQSNPLQQLLTQTAKSVLPLPVVASARQAIKIINSPNLEYLAPRARPNTVPSMSLTDGSTRRTTAVSRKNRLSSKDSSIGWYEDETMAAYLKDTQ